MASQPASPDSEPLASSSQALPELGAAQAQAEARFPTPVTAATASADWLTMNGMGFDPEAHDQYVRKLSRELGRVATLPIQDTTVERIVRRFPGWRFQTWWSASLHQRIRLILLQDVQTTTQARAIDTILPATPRRQVYRSQTGVTIRIDDQVIGEDLLQLMKVERLLRPAEESPFRSARNPAQALRKQFVQQAEAYHDAREELDSPQTLFTEKETVAMNLLSQLKNNEEIAAALNISGASVSRTLKPARQRWGLPSNFELMLVAIALDIAPISHIPFGKTRHITPEQRDILANYWQPDRQQRLAYRGQKTAATWASQLSRLYDALGTTNQRVAALYAIRDKVLRQATEAEIRDGCYRP